MKLYEFEAKSLAKQYAMPIPRGRVATNPQQAKDAYSEIGGQVVLKAQVLVAGRGKAGGIVFASSEAEAEDLAARLLGSTIKGEHVGSVLVEEKLSKARELYMALVVNRTDRCFTLLASGSGGVDIEEVAAISPEKILKVNIDPLRELHDFEARNVAIMLGARQKSLQPLAEVIRKMWQLAKSLDAELVESNPLIETPDGRFVPADLRIIVDDNALYRHRQFLEAREALAGELSPIEAEARKAGLAYVELDGEIGILGNGAGLVMATLDLVNVYGGRPANFCDVGGGASADRVATALQLILSNEKVKAVFINILGGITRCDEVARGILEAKSEQTVDRPTVIRLVGTNEEEGRRILSEAGVSSFSTMDEAARRVVELVGAD